MAQFPFPLSTMTQVYGWRNLPADPYHKGIDFGVGENTPIPCAAGGVVIDAGYRSAIQNYKEVDHGPDANGVRWTTRYHMMRNYQEGPQLGQPISQGQIIGYVGPKAGVSTGVHFHFEVHNKGVWTANYGSAVDPVTNINNIPASVPEAPLPELGEEMKLVRRGTGVEHFLMGELSSQNLTAFKDPGVSNAELVQAANAVYGATMTVTAREFDVMNSIINNRRGQFIDSVAKAVIARTSAS
ncbi:hypothetical protein GCM10027416_05910 [Okibacterium endophyticum]